MSLAQWRKEKLEKERYRKKEAKKGNYIHMDIIANLGGGVVAAGIQPTLTAKLEKEMAEAQGDPKEAQRVLDAITAAKKKDPKLKTLVGTDGWLDQYVAERSERPFWKTQMKTMSKDDIAKVKKEWRDKARKGIENTGMDPWIPGAQYDPRNHKISVPEKQKTEAIFQHERGHATKGLGKSVLQSRVVRGGGALAGLGLTIKSYLTSRDAFYHKDLKKREQGYKDSRNEALAGLGLAAGPTLAEEARATWHAKKYMGKRGWKGMKQLLPAYGTYLNALVVPAGFSVAALEYQRRKAGKERKAQEQKRGLTIKRKKSNIPAHLRRKAA